jgi:putative DNA primase/helicase
MTNISKITPQQAKVDRLYERISKKISTKPAPRDPAKLDGKTDIAIITEIARMGNSEKFFKLMAGDNSNYSSRSEADMALCSILSKVTDSPEIINSIFRGSGLYRKKWDEMRGEQTFGEITIATVLKNPNKSHEKAFSEETPQYEIVQELIKQVGRANIFFHAKQIMGWKQEKGVWKEVPEEEIKKLIHRIAHQKNLSQYQVNSVLGLFKTEIHSTINKLRKIKKRAINCKNGELHYVDSDWVLQPFNRKSFFIHQIPVNYDASASCERFKKFLNQIFAPDPDKDQKIRLLQEFMGYALIASCEYERFIMFIGQGANGKSVILVVLKALLGASNVAGVQPSQLENRFQLAHLQGKLANIITEIPQGSVIADAKLKAIVSGELMTAEHKFRAPFDFEPYATMFFSTNHLPHTKDFSSAFFRRAEILTFNREFKGDERDTTLKDKLLKELPGILNFALAGLKRLFDTGDFTQVKSSLNTKKEWERAANQVKAFVEEECTLHPAAKTSIEKLFARYSNWIEECGQKTGVNSRNFTDRLVLLGCERKKGTNGTRMIVGIKLN